MRPALRALLPAILVALLVSACHAPTTIGDGAAPDAVHVVATTTVLADLVHDVAGPRATVVSLVPKGGEVHTFDPSPSDMRAVAEADLLVMNGLGLDDWLGGLVDQTDATAQVIRLADAVPASELISGEGSAGPNPHLWLDLRYARTYVEEIRGALDRLDPAHAADIDARAAELDQRLAAEDASVRDRFATIPAADRRVVSFHDAFPYFARAYGLDVIGTVVSAPGQDPSAGEVAALIDAIRANDVAAILSEAQFSDQLVRTIANETGAVVVSDLYDDTLGDAPVDTFLGMIEWDASRILDALRSRAASGGATPSQGAIAAG